MVEENVFVISKVKCKDTSSWPLIVNFENGVLKEGREQKLASSLYKRKHEPVLVAASKKIIYTGDVTRDDTYNTFIGVIDKKRNKTSLIALDQARMSPWFEGTKSMDISEEDRALSIGELNKTFGSKKVKRQTEQMQRMKLDISNVKEQLEQTVADIDVDVKDLIPPSIDSLEKDGDYKPKIHRDAATVENVYVLDELVSSQILASLLGNVEEVLGSEDDLWSCTDFVKQELEKLQQSGSSSKKTCRLLLYVNFLIKFTLTTAKIVVTKKYVACPHSDVVSNDILQKFTIVTGNTRSRPNIMKDKCVCYILVLSMLACHYTLNLTHLSKELKIGLKKLQDICRVLGFTVTKEVAQLKLPLPPPVTPHARGKKK